MIVHQNDKQRRFVCCFLAASGQGGMTPGRLATSTRNLSCEPCAGASLEGEFGAFDDGAVVCVEAHVGRAAGHFTVADFDQTAMELGFGLPAEDDERVGPPLLEDQVVMGESHPVPDRPDFQEQEPDMD